MERPSKPEGWSNERLKIGSIEWSHQKQLKLAHREAVREYLNSIAKEVIDYLSSVDLSASEAKQVLEYVEEMVGDMMNSAPLSLMLKEATPCR